MIYFTKDTGTQAIKIGYSKKPKERLGGLQTGNPSKLILLGSIPGTENDEATFHRRFAQFQLEGEWFKGEIIEQVLEIISSHKKQRLEIRRKTVTEEITVQPPGEPENHPAGPAADKGTLDKDSGCVGICRIPGLRMKSFSLKLTESPYSEDARAQGHNRKEAAAIGRGPVFCGVSAKYVLVFEKEFRKDVPEGRRNSELSKLHEALLSAHAPARTLNHRFYDQDDALIPFCPDRNSYHVVGGLDAVTGVEGDAFRVLVDFGKQLLPNAPGNDVYLGDNYTGEHPLNAARKFVVACTFPQEPPPSQVAPQEDILRFSQPLGVGRRREIPIPEGWYYWTHDATNGKEEIIRDQQGRVVGVAIENPTQGVLSVNLVVTIRRKQDT
jgi:hypothetical protein